MFNLSACSITSNTKWHGAEAPQFKQDSAACEKQVEDANGVSGAFSRFNCAVPPVGVWGMLGYHLSCAEVEQMRQEYDSCMLRKGYKVAE